MMFHPGLLVHLRGLDVCAAELAIPTWVLLPLLLTEVWLATRPDPV